MGKFAFFLMSKILYLCCTLPAVSLGAGRGTEISQDSNDLQPLPPRSFVSSILLSLSQDANSDASQSKVFIISAIATQLLSTWFAYSLILERWRWEEKQERSSWISNDDREKEINHEQQRRCI